MSRQHGLERVFYQEMGPFKDSDTRQINIESLEVFVPETKKTTEQLDGRYISQPYSGAVNAVYLEGHLDAVYCIQFDSTKIISGSRDRTIKIWDLATNACTHTLEGHSGSVLCLQFNEKYIVSGSRYISN